MNKKAAQTIISKVNKICNIPKQNLTLIKESKTTYEIQIGKTLQEEEWLCIEEFVSNQNLRLKIADNAIILY